MAKNNNLYLRALHTLKEEIISGKYPFQSKLPSEAFLAENLNISRSTLRKILEALRSDGLIESRKGSGSFVCNKSINRYIPLIIPKDSQNYRMTDIFGGTHDYFSSIGFSPLLTLSEGNPKKETELINKLIDDGYRNFIIYPVSRKYNGLFYQSLLRKGYNCVFIDTLPNRITCDYVTSCNFLGGYAATKALIDSGHTDIAFCSLPGLSETNTIRDRFEGYVSALEQSNLKQSDRAVFINKGLPFEEFGDYVVQHLSSSAIFASTDELAVILVKKFSLSDKRPAIVGFDNTILSENFNLASVNQNLYEIGRTAAELLHKRIINPTKNYEHIYIPVSLVERASLNQGEKGAQAKLQSVFPSAGTESQPS